MVTELDFAHGARIITQGDEEGDHMFIVLAGNAHASIRLGSGEEKVPAPPPAYYRGR